MVAPWMLDGVPNDAQSSRLAVGAGLTHTSSSLTPRGGIIPSGTGTELEVTANGTANKNYNVQPGQIIVPVAGSASGGAYIVAVDSAQVGTIDDGYSSNARIDIAAVRVRPGIGWDIFTVKGADTPGTPVPAFPTDGSYQEIKRILVPSLATRPTTTVEPGDLSNAGRQFTAASGGLVPVVDGERPASPWDGMGIVERPSGREYRWYATGARWRRIVNEDEIGLGVVAEAVQTANVTVPAAGTLTEMTGLVVNNHVFRANRKYRIEVGGEISVGAGGYAMRMVVVDGSNANATFPGASAAHDAAYVGLLRTGYVFWYEPGSADVTKTVKVQAGTAGTTAVSTARNGWLKIEDKGRA